MSAANIVLKLFKDGLGELLTLHVTRDSVVLGSVVFDKGRLIVRDHGFLHGMKPAQFAPCFESGLLGMIGPSLGFAWQSLTFFGLEECALPVDLGKTRHGALVAAQNQYGESLINFTGSVYRGYQLMLDNHFLPVVTVREVSTKKGAKGLAVTDLRTVPMDLSIVRRINDVVRASVERRLVLEVEDVTVDDDEFKKLFAGYLNKKP